MCLDSTWGRPKHDTLPWPWRSLAMLSASRITPFRSATDTGVGRQAHLCSGVFGRVPGSLGRHSTTPHGSSASACQHNVEFSGTLSWMLYQGTVPIKRKSLEKNQSVECMLEKVVADGQILSETCTGPI